MSSSLQIVIPSFPTGRVAQQDWYKNARAATVNSAVQHFFLPITQLPAEMTEDDPANPGERRLRSTYPNRQPVDLPMGNDQQRATSNLINAKFISDSSKAETIHAAIINALPKHAKTEIAHLSNVQFYDLTRFQLFASIATLYATLPTEAVKEIKTEINTLDKNLTLRNNLANRDSAYANLLSLTRHVPDTAKRDDPNQALQTTDTAQ